MRTTLNLAEDVYDRARERAFREHRALGDVVSELARRGLQADVRGRVPFGRYAGRIEIADDFDATPDHIVAAMEAPLP